MIIGDIVSLNSEFEFGPKQIGSFGYILNINQSHACDVCWFDDLLNKSSISAIYGNSRVSRANLNRIDFVSHRDDNFKVGDDIVLLCPGGDYLPNSVKPFTVCKFYTMMGSGTSCKIELNGEIFQIGLKYIMKYDDYLKYNSKQNKQSDNYNKLMKDIYKSLGV